MKRHDEQGSALVLAIGVMLLVGMISAGLLSYVTTSVRGRVSLDVLRNREYAADAAVEDAITQTRSNIGAVCPDATTSTLNGATIRIDCQDYLQPVPTPAGFLVTQRNVLYLACIDGGVACTDATAIIRAQVNFEIPSGGTTVTRTYVQSWSVKR